jgi:hypothetical protein
VASCQKVASGNGRYKPQKLSVLYHAREIIDSPEKEPQAGEIGIIWHMFYWAATRRTAGDRIASLKKILCANKFIRY